MKRANIILFLILLGIAFAVSPIKFNYNFILYTENSNDIDFDHRKINLSEVSGKIHIINNSGWVAFRSAGNCTGSGSYSDPYVIEDLVIDGEGSGSCIWIENSSVFFKIENCIVFNANVHWPNAGIRLSHVSNAQLIGNNCSFYTYIGIHLYYSKNCSIVGNIGIGTTTTFNYRLINLYYSDNNSIVGNTASFSQAGIELSHSDNNTVLGNNVCNNHHGITLYYSNNNNITENIANNNGLRGVELYDSNYNIILGNTANYNSRGISIYGNYNTISGNIANSNIHTGICISFGGNNNNFTDNIANNNHERGISIYGNYNIISGNIVNNNIIISLSHTNIGISLFVSDNNNVTGNIVSYNDYGIALQRSDYNLVSGNLLTANDICIVEDDCKGNEFEDNECFDYTGNEKIEILGFNLFFLFGILGGAIILIGKRLKKY